MHLTWFCSCTHLQAPPSANHAPAQNYMLFLLNGDTYSRATWVHLGS